MTSVTGNFSEDMKKYAVTVPPLSTTVLGVEITLPAVVFEFDTGNNITLASVAGALQSYVDKYSRVPADRDTCLCEWLSGNPELGEGITSAFERALETASGHCSLGGFVAMATLKSDPGRKLTNELRILWARHCITALCNLPSPRNKEMNEKHDHKLLRPVKFKDLQVGDELILKDSSPVAKRYVTHKASKFVVLRFSDGSEGTCYAPRLEIDYGLAPLCWVEGRPVYPGAGPLYYKYDHRWKYNTEGVTALSIRDDELCFQGGCQFPISDATWTKPKRKPQLVIGGRLVPMPEREAPAEGTTYFTPDPHSVDHYGSYIWRNLQSNQRFLERGLVHLTKEAAIAHGEVLVALSKKKD